MVMMTDVPIEQIQFVEEGRYVATDLEQRYENLKNRFEVVEQVCLRKPLKQVATLLYIRCYDKYVAYLNRPKDKLLISEESTQKEIVDFIFKYSYIPLYKAQKIFSEYEFTPETYGFDT